MQKNSHPDISSITVIDFQVAFFKKGPYDELGGYDNPLTIPIFCYQEVKSISIDEVFTQ